jgi:hypothetical protein
MVLTHISTLLELLCSSLSLHLSPLVEDLLPLRDH